MFAEAVADSKETSAISTAPASFFMETRYSYDTPATIVVSSYET